MQAEGAKTFKSIEKFANSVVCFSWLFLWSKGSTVLLVWKAKVDITFNGMKVKTVRKRMSLYKWPLCELFWPFFAICMSNFHKTEALTVISRCLTLLTDWFKSYDSKPKYFHFFFSAILYKNRRFRLLHFLLFCLLCHNFGTN